MNKDCADFVETEFARLPWFRQIDAATQHQFLAIANVVTFSTDELAQELAARVTRVLFVVTGSFRVQLMDDLGRGTFRVTPRLSR